MNDGLSFNLKFYSNPLRVFVRSDCWVHISWNDIKALIKWEPALPPGIIEEFDGEPMIPLSWLTNNYSRVLNAVEYNLDNLIRVELFPYIVKELTVMRSVLPTVELTYEAYRSGIFEVFDIPYFTEEAVRNITQASSTSIPSDIPRFPVLLNVLPSTHPYRNTPVVLPVWIMGLENLPSALRANEGKPGELGPRQRFESPGIVGEHRCELDPNQKRRDMDSLSKTEALLADKSMSWVGLAWVGDKL